MQQVKYCLLIIFWTSISSHAQVPILSTDGNFQVDFNKGCTPLTVNVTSNVACPCNIYFDGGSGNPLDGNIAAGNSTFTHTYDNPGTYNFILVGNNLGRDSLEIIVHENVSPQFIASACNNKQVDVDVIDTNFDRYIVSYGDGVIDTIALGITPDPHTYAAVNSYTISVKGLIDDAKDNCTINNTSTQIIDILQNASISSILLLSAEEARLEFTASPDIQYNLEIEANGDDANGFQIYIPNIQTTSPLAISDANLDFDQNYYCFRIATYDPCSNAISGYSNTLCSINLDDVVVNNLSNHLDINASDTGLTEHSIQLQNSQNEFNQIFTLTTSTTYDDNFVDCNIQYCYRVVTNYNGLSSTSLIRCATALSLNTPTQISNISIDATASSSLTWNLPVDFIPTAYEISDENSVIGETTTPNYSDLTSSPSDSQECYQVGYIDECGNTADNSIIVCSIYLSRKTSNNITTLSWSNYNGWESGVLEYQLIKNGIETVYSGSDISFDLSNIQSVQNTTYQIVAKPNIPSLADSKSNVISITNRSNITFPNAFVVNGTNNKFKVVGRYIEKMDLKIYTRWGELIAHITNPESGWDGTQNGKKLPSGNYIYSAEIKDTAGNIHNKNGTVLLIRR